MVEFIVWVALGGVAFGLWDGKTDDRKARPNETAAYLMLSLICGPFAGGAAIGETIRKALAK